MNVEKVANRWSECDQTEEKQRLMSSFLFMWDLCAQCLYMISVHPVFSLSCLCVRRFSLRFVTSVCCSSGRSNGTCDFVCSRGMTIFHAHWLQEEEMFVYISWFGNSTSAPFVSHFCCSAHNPERFSCRSINESFSPRKSKRHFFLFDRTTLKVLSNQSDTEIKAVPWAGHTQQQVSQGELEKEAFVVWMVCVLKSYKLQDELIIGAKVAEQTTHLHIIILCRKIAVISKQFKYFFIPLN